MVVVDQEEVECHLRHHHFCHHRHRHREEDGRVHQVGCDDDDSQQQHEYPKWEYRRGWRVPLES